jgi:hypothetical protein
MVIYDKGTSSADEVLGRGVITWDKQEIISMVDAIEGESFYTELLQRLGMVRDETGQPSYDPDMEAEIISLLHERNIFSCLEFSRALHAYAYQSFALSLESPDPIVRALCMFDRRLGQLRLKSIDPTNEHSLVRELLVLRLAADEAQRHR